MSSETAPDRMLPDWLDAFMLYTENTEPPRLFRFWTAISCIAAAMQRKCYIDWGTALTFYPNFFIVLVGPSATGKGSAMNPAMEILEEIPSIRLSANATSLQALIRHLKDTNLTDIDIETGKQTYHSSLTIFNEEFTVFLGYHNKELISALCNWYDCRKRWSYETISRSKEEIVGVWVNLIGGTTPDLIQSSLPIESIGGGLTSRIIFVYEEQRGKLVIHPIQTAEEKELYKLLVHDLEQISMLSGRFSFTSSFSEAWQDWCIEAEQNPPFHDPKFDGYNGRRRTHLMKLAMICSASHGKNGLVLTSDDLIRASGLLAEVEIKMGNVFRGVGQSNIAGLINRSVMYLQRLPSGEIPVHTFARHFGGDMDKFTLDRVLQTLEVSQMVKVLRSPGAPHVIKLLKEGK